MTMRSGKRFSARAKEEHWKTGACAAGSVEEPPTKDSVAIDVNSDASKITADSVFWEGTFGHCFITETVQGGNRDILYDILYDIRPNGFYCAAPILPVVELRLTGPSLPKPVRGDIGSLGSFTGEVRRLGDVLGDKTFYNCHVAPTITVHIADIQSVEAEDLHAAVFAQLPWPYTHRSRPNGWADMPRYCREATTNGLATQSNNYTYSRLTWRKAGVHATIIYQLTSAPDTICIQGTIAKWIAFTASPGLLYHARENPQNGSGAPYVLEEDHHICLVY
ncbi:hypothetical protein BV898_02273 [Hypsibius exemplaris]|uniref:Uncharacterized protein n=1 Tax=Hypsibius exemplaris TaxID=2072580 RepID=A0A1W0X8Q5_HYPEX|nr:hypothetical protein BV898_02273 [Hypsibius exemplaris]